MRLPPPLRGQVRLAIRALLSQYHQGRPSHDERPLQGRAGGCRIRSGDYRILYVVDTEATEIVVWRVRHRREAYREI